MQAIAERIRACDFYVGTRTPDAGAIGALIVEYAELARRLVKSYVGMRARDCSVYFGRPLYEYQIIAPYDALALVEHFGHAPYVESRFLYHNFLLLGHTFNHCHTARAHFARRGLWLSGFGAAAPDRRVLDVEKLLTPFGAALGGKFQFNPQPGGQLTPRAREVVKNLAPRLVVRFEYRLLDRPVPFIAGQYPYRNVAIRKRSSRAAYGLDVRFDVREYVTANSERLTRASRAEY
jgi:hypothetical protein